MTDYIALTLRGVDIQAEIDPDTGDLRCAYCALSFRAHTDEDLHVCAALVVRMISEEATAS